MICAYEGCDASLEGMPARAQYCSRRHKEMAKNQRKRQPVAGRAGPDDAVTAAPGSSARDTARSGPAARTLEPFRPSQAQTAVTEAMTGVRLDLELCTVCCTNRGVGDHHITFRSRGGEEGPTMPACVRCHQRVHDAEWIVSVEDDGLEIHDREGQLVWRLKRWPESLAHIEAGQFVQLLDRVCDATKLMPEIAPALLPWQATEVFRALREAQDGGWRAQTRLAGEFAEYRLPHLSGPEKVQALCELFGVRKSQMFNYLQIARAFADSPVLEDSALSMGYAVEAARAKDPVRWLEHAQEVKLTHAAYSREDLREEIIRAGDRKWVAEETVTEAVAVKRAWGKCSGCGRVGWFEKLPVGSGQDA